jgi:hypothetical protein
MKVYESKILGGCIVVGGVIGTLLGFASRMAFWDWQSILR